jgi:trehalose 6-phosphate synthase
VAQGDSTGRIVIVSNRAPVAFARGEDGERTHSRGAGGLVTALGAVARRRTDAVWIASASSEEDRAVARESGGEPFEVEDLKVALVEHDETAYGLMYNEIANPLLWFVQHGLYDQPYAPNHDADTRRAWEEGYLPVNENFARAVARSLESEGGDGGEPTILVHDYQLYAAPRLLREALGDGPFVSLFVHIPWPDPDGWRVLPRYVRRDALESLLAADVVAFHTERYAANFVRAAGEVLGAETDLEGGLIRHSGRETHARAYPISIDPAEFEELARSEKVLGEEEAVKDLPGKLILRVDRMDLSKNIVRGFLAYGRMLDRHPEWRGEVTFFALLQPSRGGVAEYARYAEAVERAVEEINERHRTGSWEPIVLKTEDNFPRSVAAYKNYDVLLVNAVRDGMNLVAKEAAVANARAGVLVLSENAGAHEEMGEHALTVNPFDLDETADALHEALSMPTDERRRRAEALKATVLNNTVDDWVEAQLRDIAELRRP